MPRTVDTHLDAIYRQNHRWMIKRALQRLGNLPAAEDIVHDTFSRVIERIDVTEIQNVPAYLSRALDNCIIAAYRRTGSREVLGEIEEEAAVQEGGEDFDRLEEKQILASALNSLKPRQRRALSLLAEGFSVGEIARRLGTSSHNASALLLRAKANLRRESFKRGLMPLGIPGLFDRARVRAINAWQRVEGLLRLDPRMLEILAVATAVAVFGAGGLIDRGHSGQHSANRETREVAVSDHTESPLRSLDHDEPGSRAYASPGRAGLHVEEDGTAWANISDGERESRPEPSLLEQLLAIAEDPGKLLPECGGFIQCPN